MNKKLWNRAAKVIGASSLLLAVLIPLQVQATAKINDVVVISEMATDSIAKFNGRVSDENVVSLKKKFSLKKSDLKNISSKDTTVVASINVLKEDSKILKEVIKRIHDSRQVYVFGEELTVKEIENLFGISIEPPVNDEKVSSSNPTLETWQYIGVQQKTDGSFQVHFGNLQSLNKINGEIVQVPPSEDLILQSILSAEEKEQTDQNAATAITPFGYTDDPIVKSQYDAKSEVYFSNTKRGELNVDWILHRNISNDSDPTYDYFYLEDASEVTAYNGWVIGDLKVKHKLTFPASDEIRDWGPDSSDGTSYTVGLPWAVSWTFSSDADVDIQTDGSQTEDWASWNVNERWWQYHISSPVRIKPGTAWASTGTYAAIDAEHTAWVREGGGTIPYSMSVTKNITYDY